MVAVHSTVGALVILAFIASAIVYVLASRGRTFTWAPYVSFGAASLLLIQVLLGFSLLGDDHHNVAAHYVLAIVALASLGFEHGYARSRPTPAARASYGAVANVVTLVLVVATYLVGQANGS